MLQNVSMGRLLILDLTTDKIVVAQMRIQYHISKTLIITLKPIIKQHLYEKFFRQFKCVINKPHAEQIFYD